MLPAFSCQTGTPFYRLLYNTEEASAGAQSLMWGVWNFLLFSWPVATSKVSEDAMSLFAGVGGPNKASKGEHVTHCLFTTCHEVSPVLTIWQIC